MDNEIVVWGCEHCYSYKPCNCEAIIAQQDAETKEMEEEKLNQKD
jgi:hypothetical protein